MVELVARIRELLEARQLSPTQFADVIGIGRPVVSHILSGRNKPSLEVVQKIITAFPDLALPLVTERRRRHAGCRSTCYPYRRARIATGSGASTRCCDSHAPQPGCSTVIKLRPRLKPS